MNGFFESLKFTAFEIIAYVLPGYIALAFVVYHFNFPNIDFLNDYVLVFIISFILGHIVHNLSTIVTIKLTDIGWYIYHTLKEKEEDGKGKQNPQTSLGKLIKKLRYAVLERHKDTEDKLTKTANDNLVSQNVVKSGLHGLDMYYIKEIIFVKDERVSEYFQFTHYYSVLCRSLSFISAVICITLCIATFYEQSYELKMVSSVLISGAIFKIFLNRHLFYKQYRSALINSFAILYKEPK